ncbi:MAG: 6-bladed beta-propeller [Bacteroidales bacterium]
MKTPKPLKTYLLGLFLFSLFFGCKNEVKNKLDILVIDVNPESSNDIVLSDIFSKSEYIPLQTDSNTIIGGINSMKIYGENIFINDGNSIFQFTKKGQFVNKIGIKGKGPGEFINLKDFRVDTVANILEILDLNGKKIVYYNLNGRFIEQWELGLYAYDYYKISDTRYVFYSGYEQNSNTNFSLNILEKESNKIIKKDFPINENMAWYYYLMQARHFVTIKDSLFCFRDPFDTIYYVADNEILPSRVLSFGNYKMPLKFIYDRYEDIMEFGDKAEENSYVHHVNHYIENDSYIFFTFRFKYEKYHVYYNKNENNIYVGKAIINDLKLNGLNSNADYTNIPETYDDKAFYYVIEPYLFLDQLKKIKGKCNSEEWDDYLIKNPDVNKILQTLSLNSNPIIGIYYIKQ